jgi:hypothetical protein
MITNHRSIFAKKVDEKEKSIYKRKGRAHKTFGIIKEQWYSVTSSVTISSEFTV